MLKSAGAALEGIAGGLFAKEGPALGSAAPPGWAGGGLFVIGAIFATGALLGGGIFEMGAFVSGPPFDREADLACIFIKGLAPSGSKEAFRFMAQGGVASAMLDFDWATPSRQHSP